MNISDRVTSGTILSTFTALSIKPPKALAAAYFKADDLTKKAAAIGVPDGALETAVTASILAGNDPASDPEVQRIVTARAIGNLTDSLTGAATEIVREACALHLDDIVIAWRLAFDEAASTLAAARRQIGDLPLDDTTSILSKGGDIADVWAKAQAAASTLDTTINGWVSLMQFMRVSLDARHRPLRLADLTFDQWQELPAKLKPWDALIAGLTLSLPTLDEYRQRVAKVQAAQVAGSTKVDTYRSAIAGREIRVSV